MRNDSGTPVTPLTANVVVTPPPSTVSGAEAATREEDDVHDAESPAS